MKHIRIMCAALALSTFVTQLRAGEKAASSPWEEVRSFAIQLQNADPAALARSPFRLVVLDFSRDGTDATAYTPAEITSIKQSGRLAVAYLSVGEAEDYRFYWKREWNKEKPAWIGPENPDWKGNYKVRFWEPEWQKLLEAWLDRMIDAGFDGAFLDVVDAGEFWADEERGAARRPGAEKEMVELVKTLASHARKKHPGFGIFPNGGEGLLRFPDYVAVVDGIFREDIWYDGNSRNKPSIVDETLLALRPLLAAHKPVFAIDYVTRPELVDDFYKKALAAGTVPYATVRALDRLTIHPPPVSK